MSNVFDIRTGRPLGSFSPTFEVSEAPGLRRRSAGDRVTVIATVPKDIGDRLLPAANDLQRQALAFWAARPSPTDFRTRRPVNGGAATLPKIDYSELPGGAWSLEVALTRSTATALIGLLRSVGAVEIAAELDHMAM